jgi:type II restriction enzyme
MDECYKVSTAVELITPARFLFNAGSTPKTWNEKILSDAHFKVIDYEPDSSAYFPLNDIKGGIAISYRNSQNRYKPIEMFIPYAELKSIYDKTIIASVSQSISEIIYTQTRYDLDSLYDSHPEMREVIGSNGKDKRFRNNAFEKVSVFTDAATVDSIEVLGLLKNKRVRKYISRSFVDENHENLNKWKVLVARANGSGAFGEILSTPVVAGPGVGYTQSFIGIGSFDAQNEAEACLKYLKGRFARALLGVLKITQDNDRGAWKCVPIQNFSSNSDIDWAGSVSSIDRQLYRKYGLSKEEVGFIESHVKEME